MDSAKRILTELRVRSLNSCFVSPNAKCPVCQQDVFFYQNMYGSRVFFDELGPPWPKHPCTISKTQSKRNDFLRPTQRPSTEIRKILDADNLAGTYFTSEWGRRNETWALYVVVKTLRSTETIRVFVESVSSKDIVKRNFTIKTKRNVVDEGDLVSYNGKIFSFIGRELLTPINVNEFDGSSAPEHRDQKKASPVNAESDGEVMPQADPFSNNNMSRQDFMRICERKVRRLDSRGPIEPITLAREFNREGFRTARGMKWDAALSATLLEMIGYHSWPKPRQTKKFVAPSKNYIWKSIKTRHGKGAGISTDGRVAKSSRVDPSKSNSEKASELNLESLREEVDKLRVIMDAYQDERNKPWISEKRRQVITQRFHSVKKKHDEKMRIIMSGNLS
ncbi:hypothetical protein [Roseicyclus marinus]|uniref:hypothetical protein n=1 Tax=Roseicyclus marinus TaxID=2161673 RepID=UPI00240F178C|nr:hypothetical protein [Roseicyclus marinus]MDG3039832.1 hypothetical protein [Roseicyclus marinus]